MSLLEVSACRCSRFLIMEDVSNEATSGLANGLISSAACDNSSFYDLCANI